MSWQLLPVERERAKERKERAKKKKLLGLYDLVLEVTRHHLLHSVHQKEVIKYSTYSREGELGFTF